MKGPSTLRSSLLISLTVLALLLVLAYLSQHSWGELLDLEEQSLAQGLSLSQLIVPSLEADLSSGDLGKAGDMLSRLSLFPDRTLALICDSDDRVLLGNDFRWNRGSLASSPAAEGLSLVRTARSTLLVQKEVSRDHNQIRVAFPFYLATLSTEIRPSRVAVLVLQVDLSQARARALERVLRESALASVVVGLACLLLWVFLRLSFTRHLEALTQAVQSYSLGGTPVSVPQSGPTELRKIAAVLNTILGDLSQEHAELLNSEQRLRTLSDNIPHGASYQIDTGVDGTERCFTYLSAGAERLHGYPVSELLADANLIYNQIHEDDRAHLAAQELISHEQWIPFSAEVRMRLPSGEIRWYLITSAPRRSAHGHIVWDGIELDITDRKTAEEAVKAALIEKETLLRELYHRTKNNMNVVIAILKLQASFHDNDELRQVFVQAENQILSMALVHQVLYDQGDLSLVSMHSYLEELLRHLVSSYQTESRQIQVHLEAQDVPLLLDSAVPCGLILNELISNSFKHAFPEGQPGEVVVKLSRDAVERITFEVKDNGKGLPPNYDPWQQGGMGFQTALALAETQLGAEVVLERYRGFGFRWSFFDNQYRRRV